MDLLDLCGAEEHSSHQPTGFAFTFYDSMGCAGLSKRNKSCRVGMAERQRIEVSVILQCYISGVSLFRESERNNGRQRVWNCRWLGTHILGEG